MRGLSTSPTTTAGCVARACFSMLARSSSSAPSAARSMVSGSRSPNSSSSWCRSTGLTSATVLVSSMRYASRTPRCLVSVTGASTSGDSMGTVGSFFTSCQRRNATTSRSWSRPYSARSRRADEISASSAAAA